MFEGRWWRVGGELGVDSGGRDEDFVSGVIIVELVPGRDTGEDMPGLLWMTTPAISPAFLFLEEGRGGLERSGFPNASPAAAIPTVLEATSC